MMNKKILLVEPDFPFPTKSKNKADSVHKNFVPIGLLKFGSYHKSKGDKVKLVRGKKTRLDIGFIPDEILVTSLFTYWSNYVWDSIDHYRNLFPRSKIKLGGIYATLHKDTEKMKKLASKYKVDVYVGVNEEAEKHIPDYNLIPNIEYHATHMMRGCIRRCSFCGTWKIEPKILHKTKDEIIIELQKVGKNVVIFYDNNLLANPHINEILEAFQVLKINKKPVIFESQSGFDGRILEKKPELARLIRKARFQNIRIAWDNGLEDGESIKNQIKILVNSGYTPKDLSVFMIYNFDIPYEDMLKKIEHCHKLGVQITDCRNRPLDLDYDNYSPHMKNGQPEGSFYVHKKSGWTDKKIREFRRKVRQHNIEIRYAKDKGSKYDPKMEKWSAIHNVYKFFKLGSPPKMDIIENNNKIKRRIEYLRKLKHYHEKFSIEKPDFSKIPINKLDLFLDKLFDMKSKESINDEQRIHQIIRHSISKELLN